MPTKRTASDQSTRGSGNVARIAEGPQGDLVVKLPARNRREFLKAYAVDRDILVLHDMYNALDESGLADVDGGRDVVQDGQLRFQRDARNFVSQNKRKGGQRVGPGAWTNAASVVATDRLDEDVLESGRLRETYRSVFVIDGNVSDLTLNLQTAKEMFLEQQWADAPFDFVVADGPWGKNADQPGYANHAHDEDTLAHGYNEWPRHQLQELYEEWLTVAYDSLRLGGSVSIVTGRGQAADVQMAARHAGFTDVDVVVQPHPFVLETSRQHAPSSWFVTTVCKGPFKNPERTWKVLPELPRSRNGRPYPTDIWPPGVNSFNEGYRYTVSQPVWFWERVIRVIADRGDLGAFPFVGGGNPLIAAYRLGMRGVFCDTNPEAIMTSQARLLAHLASPTLDIAPQESRSLELDQPVPKLVGRRTSDSAPTLFDKNMGMGSGSFGL